MKITYLKLKNFASVFSGMNKTTVEIDFTKGKNRVIIFVGPNGSGKTSIMSALHPFAYNKEDETRDNDKLILEEKEGYKEIHYVKDDSQYVIKHHYLYKSGKRSVKSFISLNNTELNPNGNVTSFTELIKTHLGIEPSYLTLLRLGGDVRNFIDKKYTERKEFASNLMSEIYIYNTFFKKVTEESRVLRNLLKTTMSKIDRLHVIDENELIRAITDTTNLMTEKDSQYDNLTMEIGGITREIQTITMDETGFNVELSDLRSEVKRLVKEIESKEGKINPELLTDRIYEMREDINNQVISKKSELDKVTFELDFILDNLSSVKDKMTEKKQKLQFITTESEKQLLVDKIEQLKSRRDSIKAKLNGYTDTATVDELINIIRLCQDIEEIVTDISTYSMNSITLTQNLSSTRDLTQYLIESKRQLQTEITDYQARLKAMEKQESEFIYFMYVPNECKEEKCPYMEFYNDHTKKDNEEEKLTLKSNLTIARNKLDSLDDVTYLSQRISQIQNIISANRSLIEKTSCQKIFDMDNISKSFISQHEFYSEESITLRISKVEELDELRDLENDIINLQSDLSSINADNDGIKILTTDIEEYNKEIAGLETRVIELKLKKNNLTSEYSILKQELETIEEAIVLNKEIDELIIDCKSKKDELDKKESDFIKLGELKKELRIKENQKHNCVLDIQNLKSRHDDLQYKLREFKNLKADKEQLEAKYDKAGILRESLSNNKGIPLLFQQIYLKDVRIIVNDLLDMVYGGQLSVEEFVINDKEFRIPYVKNGILINDVASSSQGEKAFITLALSFALIIKTIEDYNILLLDEIDATLDTKSRMLFINILEKFMDTNASEQVFVISHNNMFDSYPVDIIYTTNEHPKSDNIIWEV